MLFAANEPTLRASSTLATPFSYGLTAYLHLYKARTTLLRADRNRLQGAHSNSREAGTSKLRMRLLGLDRSE